jgi:hypothetical protein
LRAASRVGRSDGSPRGSSHRLQRRPRRSRLQRRDLRRSPSQRRRFRLPATRLRGLPLRQCKSRWTSPARFGLWHVYFAVVDSRCIIALAPTSPIVQVTRLAAPSGKPFTKLSCAGDDEVDGKRTSGSCNIARGRNGLFDCLRDRCTPGNHDGRKDVPSAKAGVSGVGGPEARGANRSRSARLLGP